jgi:serine/threonine protein kinase
MASFSTSSRDHHDERETNERPSRRTQKFNHETILSWIQPQNSTNKIGEGSFGTVFRGKDSQGRDIAVKVLGEEQRELALSNRAFRENMAQMFGAEIAVLSRLDHPNIVQLHGFGKFVLTF